MNRTKRLWKTQDVAEYLNVTEATVRSLVKKGKLTCVRIGDSKQARMRFDPDDVYEFARNRKGGS